MAASPPAGGAAYAGHQRFHRRWGLGWLGASALAVLPALALAGCEAREEPASTHARPRIVSLNPCTDAILAEVASPDQLLAISHYSQDPAASSMDIALARRFAVTSGSVEEIAALSPDVVVASVFLAPSTAQALRSLGIRVVREPMPVDIEAALAQVRKLAALTGDGQAGDALVRRIETAMARAAPPADALPIPALVWQSGGIVAGDDTLIARLMRRTGFVNAAASRGLAQADYLPLERVLADPPRVIFAVGSPAAEEDRLLRHPAISRLPEVVRAPLDNSLLWCGGPTIPRALERLAQIRSGLAPRRPGNAAHDGGTL